jgi:hypothetical protein
MILALAFLMINLIVDVLYVYLDPRVQPIMSANAAAENVAAATRRTACPAARPCARAWPATGWRLVAAVLLG